MALAGYVFHNPLTRDQYKSCYGRIVQLLGMRLTAGSYASDDAQISANNDSRAL